jgi:hypothetical protein
MYRDRHHRFRLYRANMRTNFMTPEPANEAISAIGLRANSVGVNSAIDLNAMRLLAVRAVGVTL